MDLAFLFISAFAASTILPMSSEIVLSALALGGATEVWLLLTVATTGNNSRGGRQLGHRPLLPVERPVLDHRHGGLDHLPRRVGNIRQPRRSYSA
jgi:hypothetical protein